LIGGQEHREGPSTTATDEKRNGRLINLIEIGPLFPIHLDIYKMPIHEFGNRLVFKRFFFHNVAPMAGRVTD
jgi:hypothetical protein